MRVKLSEWVVMMIGWVFLATSLIYDDAYLNGIAAGIFGVGIFTRLFSWIIDRKHKVVFFYKDNVYVYEGLVSFKHPDTREWVTAVRYSDKQGNQYAREVKEFNKLFTKI